MKQRAIIFDIDGTLATIGDRGIFEYENVSVDIPNEPIINILQAYVTFNLLNEDEEKKRIILITGREDRCMDETVEWMDKHKVYFDELYMRPTGDRRPDIELKKEIWEKNIKDKYDVLFVVEDRYRVVRMWRKLGITCLQVAEGNY